MQIEHPKGEINDLHRRLEQYRERQASGNWTGTPPVDRSTPREKRKRVSQREMAELVAETCQYTRQNSCTRRYRRLIGKQRRRRTRKRGSVSGRRVR